ncbi:MAG: M48 family metalloprotease [Planctomycetota bacterium]
MTRLLVLLPIIFWLTMPERESAYGAVDTGMFLSGFALIVLMYWGLVRVLLGRRDGGWGATGSARRGMSIARGLSVAWFVFGLYQLGFPAAIERLGLPGTALPAIVATLPAYACWAALHATRFPVERQMWEQSLADRLANGAPVHKPPTLWGYVSGQMRVGVLFAMVPVGGVLLLRDAAVWLLERSGIDTATPTAETAISFGGIAVIFLGAPVLLRRVLPTSSMAEGPLRDRLEHVARKTGLKFRDILIWHTDNAVANAAVMGLFPQVRYVLLSDLLIETMTDRQIEAVFAHEVGHVRHRHMVWYVVFVAVLMLILAGPGTDAERWLRSVWVDGGDAIAFAIVGVTIASFLFLLGLLSRQFEQQADVFAARNVTREPDAPEVMGAMVFSTALRRVAQINGMPMTVPPLRATPTGTVAWLLGHAGSFMHGTIRQRMDAVQEIASDSGRARRFDQRMFFVRALLLVLLAAGGFWLWMAPS